MFVYITVTEIAPEIIERTCFYHFQEISHRYKSIYYFDC